MIKEITKPVFVELTKNTIVLCDKKGFEEMQNLFFPFKTNKEGHEGYYFNCGANKKITIENETEFSFDVKLKDQMIRVFLVIYHYNQKVYLQTLKYEKKDVWFARNNEIYALSEYKYTFTNFSDFIVGDIMGRFGHFQPEEIMKENSFWKVKM